MIKIEAYEYLVPWNPNEHAGYEPSTHPNPNGLRILTTVRNIGRSLSYRYIWLQDKYYYMLPLQ